jgi:hypothetical protein
VYVSARALNHNTIIITRVPFRGADNTCVYTEVGISDVLLRLTSEVNLLHTHGRARVTEDYYVCGGTNLSFGRDTERESNIRLTVGPFLRLYGRRGLPTYIPLRPAHLGAEEYSWKSYSGLYVAYFPPLSSTPFLVSLQSPSDRLYTQRKFIPKHVVFFFFRYSPSLSIRRKLARANKIHLNVARLGYRTRSLSVSLSLSLSLFFVQPRRSFRSTVVIVRKATRSVPPTPEFSTLIFRIWISTARRAHHLTWRLPSPLAVERILNAYFSVSFRTSMFTSHRRVLGTLITRNGAAA